MDNILFQQYKIGDRSYLSYIKREIHSLVRPVFSEQRAGEINIVIAELTSNLIKHAEHGEILYRLSEENSKPVFEVICIDNGMGIKDLSNAVKDGTSSKNTLGHGLGAIIRLSNIAQFYSMPGWGLVAYCKCFADIDYVPPKSYLTVGCLNVALPGESVCGDGVSIRMLKDRTMIMVAYGLGHGPHAKQAVDMAAEKFRSSFSSDPSEILREINLAVKKTRGLVGTVAVLDHAAGRMELCGVGNIYSRIQKGLEFRNYTGNNGIIGMNMPGRLENTVFEITKPVQLIFCSDGIKTKWDLVKYPGISKYEPMMLAALLYKDHARQTDDMTILALKIV